MIIKQHLKEYFEDWDISKDQLEELDRTIDSYQELFESFYQVIEDIAIKKDESKLEELENFIDAGLKENDDKKDT